MTRADPSGAIRGEFLEAYLVEVDELLGVANGMLLAIDAPQRRGTATPREVRELFRAMHTVKGLSAMVGVDPIVAVAHRAEALLRAGDRAGGRLQPGAVDLLLEAARAVEQRIRSLGARKPVAPAPAALLDALDALAEGAAPAPTVGAAPVVLDPVLESRLAAFEKDSLARGVLAGRRAICLRFAPSPALAAAGVNINSVRDRLAGVSELVKVVPVSVPKSDAAPAGLSFAILLLTRESDATLSERTGLPTGAIEVVSEGREAPPEVAVPLLPVEDEWIPDDSVGQRSFVRVDVERLDDALTQLASVTRSRAALAREVARMAGLGHDVRDLHAMSKDQDRSLRGLRAAILRLRMVPVSEVLERVPLIVRGLRRSTGKSVRVEIDSGRAELDKSVAERIFPAIVHLVRNAVDHGMESPEEREALGKPAEGVVRIACRAQGSGRLELVVSDDGRGVDAAEVARRAGRPVPETQAQLLQLLCSRGLSTRDEVTDTSGRGMGMDIVRRIVAEQLGGELVLLSAPGEGTSFALRIPLTITIVDALAFACGDQAFLVPMSTVDAIVELEPGSIVAPPGTRGLGLFRRGGETLPLVRLDAVFGMAPSDHPRPKALVVRREEVVLAFAVDRMLGQHEIVVRPLADPLITVPGISGAADLGDGRATLVIDLYALGARLASAQGAA